MMARKTDNKNLQAKLDLRRYFLRKYHGDGKADVLDCCAGHGRIWSQLRREFQISSYVGIDKQKRQGILCMDSTRYLAGRWTHSVIDVDTYGSPWKHWALIAHRMKADTTIFLTVGFWRAKGGGMLSMEERRCLGIESLPIPPGIGGILQPLAVRYCLFGQSRVEISEAAEIAEQNVRYIGLRCSLKI